MFEGSYVQWLRSMFRSYTTVILIMRQHAHVIKTAGGTLLYQFFTKSIYSNVTLSKSALYTERIV